MIFGRQRDLTDEFAVFDQSDAGRSRPGHGGRYDAGFWLACQLRDSGCPGAEGEAALLDYAHCVPPVNGKGRRDNYSEGRGVSERCQRL
jgi:hypothetical protein